MGAADVLVIVNHGKRLLIVANYQNDRGSTNVMSATYLWDETVLRFSDSPFQYLSTKGARILEKMVIGNTTYVMIGNYFDSEMQSFEVRCVLYLKGHCAKKYDYIRVTYYCKTISVCSDYS